MVEVQGLRRAYGSFEALRGVSFSIAPGEIVGLLGPNGAGKTTMMKILTGFLASTGGQAMVCGHDALRAPLQVQQRLGYLPEAAPVHRDMRVGDYLDFIARVRGLGAAERAHAIDRVCEDTGLSMRRRQPIATLSRGYRQRVGLAQALVHAPELLILDEPTTGLDPNQIVEIRDLIRRVGATRTVILSTHILPEVQVTCDRVLILHEGALVADGSVDEVVAHTHGFAITLGLASATVCLADQAVCDGLSAISGVRRVLLAPANEGMQRFTVHAEHDLRAEVFRWAVAQGQVLVELAMEQTQLEDVFRRLTLDPQPSQEASI